MECTIRCFACDEAEEAVDEFGHCERCAPLREEKRKVSVQFDSRTIVMDVTLGDSVLSVKERIKEAFGLTTNAASIMLVELYDNRRVPFATNLRATIIDDYYQFWRDVDYAERRYIPPVIELTARLRI